MQSNMNPNMFCWRWWNRVAPSSCSTRLYSLFSWRPFPIQCNWTYRPIHYLHLLLCHRRQLYRISFARCHPWVSLSISHSPDTRCATFSSSFVFPLGRNWLIVSCRLPMHQVHIGLAKSWFYRCTQLSSRVGRLNGLSACPAAKPHAPQLLFIVSCEMPMHQVHIGLDCSLLPSLYFLNCRCIESMFMLDLIAAYSLLISCTTLLAHCIFVKWWCIESMLNWIAAYSFLLSCTTPLAYCILWIAGASSPCWTGLQPTLYSCHAPQLLLIVSRELPIHRAHIGLDCNLFSSSVKCHDSWSLCHVN